MKHLYSYEGPVMEFDDCACFKWKASTVAVSEAKARSNLCHQYRVQAKCPNNRPISLPGKLKIEK